VTTFLSERRITPVTYIDFEMASAIVTSFIIIELVFSSSLFHFLSSCKKKKKKENSSLLIWIDVAKANFNFLIKFFFFVDNNYIYTSIFTK